jgi:spore germination protein YaaH
MQHNTPPAAPYEEPSQLTRRNMLTLLALGAGAALSASASACTSSQPPEPTAPRITAYLPTWLPEAHYLTTQNALNSTNDTIDRIHLAFAIFNQEDAVVSPPPLPPGLIQLAQNLPATTDLSLSIGGATARETAWQAAWVSHQRFAKSIDNTRLALEDIFQRPIHIDINCEAAMPGNTLTDIVHAVRDSLGKDRQLSMAVAADPAPGAFNMQPGQLGDVVQTFRIMTYDKHGPWSKTAGHIATGPWVLSAIDAWVQRAGSAARIEVGYPAYGYIYPGARQAGDAFSNHATEGNTILFKDIPSDSVRNNLEGLTSEAIVDNNWTSCLSPQIIAYIAAEIRHRHPRLGGSFFWSMDGLTPAHISAAKR